MTTRTSSRRSLASSASSTKMIGQTPSKLFGDNLSLFAHTMDTEGERRPMSAMGFPSARHLVPERLPSARREKPIALRLIDLNRTAVEQVQRLGASLRRLDVSSLELNPVPSVLLEDLVALERLDISNNQIGDHGLPDSLRNLENLMEFTAHHNRLSVIPGALRKLKHLARLKLGHNQIRELSGIEKFKRLQILVIEGNKLTALPKELFGLKRLEVLHCGGNRITAVPPEIKHLKHLREFDISHNALSSLPVEVFLLSRIDSINASGNQISRLPTIVIKHKVKRLIASVDVSENALVKFPEHLLEMAAKLELSSNGLKSIPISILKHIDPDSDQQLVVADNPLTTPPKDICDCGQASILQYFEEVKFSLKHYQGIRVLVLGAPGSGKTSLVQTLCDGQSRVTELEGSTQGIEIYDTYLEEDNQGPLGRLLNLSLWDVSGSFTHMAASQIFLEKPQLVLMVVNLATYKAEEFYQRAGHWLDWVLSKTNALFVIPIGTMADRLSREVADDRCADIRLQIAKHIEKHKTTIEREIELIEKKTQISPAMSEQLKHYLGLLRMDTRVFPDTVKVSSAKMLGFDGLIKAIKALGLDTELFPSVMRVIPTLWTEVEDYIELKGRTMQVPLVQYHQMAHDVDQRFSMKHLLPNILRYMHQTGKLLWFDDDPIMKQHVFLRTVWLTDILKAMYRTDLELISHSEDEVLRSIISTRAKFDKMKAGVSEDGSIERDLLKYLWSAAMPGLTNKVTVEVAQRLVEFFELGYPLTVATRRDKATVARSDRRSSIVAAPSERSSPSLRTDSRLTNKHSSDHAAPTPTDGGPRIAALVLPWLRRSTRTADCIQEMDRFKDSPKVSAVFRFPKYFPPGLFGLITVRLFDEQFQQKMLYHWRDGVYTAHDRDPTRIHLQHIPHDDGSTCVAVHSILAQPLTSQLQADDFEMLWTVYVKFLANIDELLATYVGLRCERYMECPDCHALSFMGEWSTPKELQQSESRLCEYCKNEVPTAFLIQPKEKKKVEEFLIQKLMEEVERRKLEESTATDGASSVATRPDDPQGRLENITEEKQDEIN